MGDYVRAGLLRLAARHALIGDIRGHGLWIGIELVTIARRTPATETARIVNRMKEHGILLNRIGEFDNVLKIRPPLPFATRARGPAARDTGPRVETA